MDCKQIKNEEECKPPSCKYVKGNKRQYCRTLANKRKTRKVKTSSNRREKAPINMKSLSKSQVINCKVLKEEECNPPSCKYVKGNKRQYCRTLANKRKTRKANTPARSQTVSCKDLKEENCKPPSCKYVKTEKRQYCRSSTRGGKEAKKKIEKQSVKKAKVRVPQKVYDAIEQIRIQGESYLSELSREDISQLLELSNRVYRLGLEQLMGDEEYDMLWEYAKEHHPDLPQVMNVGLEQCSGRMKKLPHYMGSLDKIKDKESDFTKFKKKHKSGDTYIVSDKLDGVSALLYCKLGEEPKLYTRGNGNTGQDITDILEHIRGVNKEALGIDEETNVCKRDISIRGELIIQKRIYSEKYKGKYISARYTVAGSVIAKDRSDKTDILKDIEFVAYEQVLPKASPENQIKNLKEEYRFKVVNNNLYTFTDLTKDTLALKLRERRANSQYDIDGLVVMKNEIYKPIIKGNPKYAVAFKMLLDDQMAETTVTGVEWNISKHGYLIPKIHVEKVVLKSGSASKMSGFNARFIVNNKIGPGAKVYVKRSGDVLPTIHRVKEQATEAALPTEYDYDWDVRKVHFVLKSVTPNPKVQIKRIKYFFHSLGGYYLSLGTITKLYNNDFTTVRDFLQMKPEDILAKKIRGIAKKKSEKIVKTIQNSIKNANLIMKFDATNRFGSSFGSRRLYMVSIQYPDAFDLSIPDETRMDGLMTIKGFGQKSAEKFIRNLERVYQFIAENNVPIPDNVVDYFKRKNEKMDKYLVGVNVVFTELLNIDGLENKILSEGANIQNMPDETTTDVITGKLDSTNEKMELARELCLPIYTVAQFKDKYNLHDY
jgi:DNA ligase (NAD+)